MTPKAKSILLDILCELGGCMLIAFATYNVAAPAAFAISGFSGIALILYRLFGVSMGLTYFVLNIPFALICWKLIGFRFLAKSIRCIVIQSLLMDFVAPLLPVLSLDRMISALIVGVFYGVAFAIIYMRGSSTGGIDFIIMLVKHYRPYVKTGVISFLTELVTLAAAGIIFKDIEAVVYGVLIIFLSTTTIDRIILGMNSGAVAWIVTEKGNGPNIAKQIDTLTSRGATILPGAGSYHNDEKDIVLVTGTYKEIYAIRRHLKTAEPKAFTIILDSKEVQGEGFEIRKVAGETE